ncbi:MAG: HAD family hydrolase [Alphaproteobacteria bacterium]|nr:HAD family hydrolase [Alphaproteobacteria bacterium]
MGSAWHTLSREQALETVGSGEKGLSEEQARERLAEHGPNKLPEPKRRGPPARFFSQFNNVLIYVLLLCALITALLGHLVDAGVIFGVVIVNAIIGYLQEGKAEKAMESIRQMLAPTANVLRGGRRRAVPGEELVPGDIVVLEAGDKIPADLRILKAHGFSVQEAILTGESVPVEKTAKHVAGDVPLGDRSCMGFSGTLVASGSGKGVVVETGAKTEIGQISGMIGAVEEMTTPLIQKMDRFAKVLTGIILFFSVAILLFGYYGRGMPFEEIFLAVVGLAVAAIPEGMPAVMTVTLAIGVQIMARRKAIVRRLPAIETLGSVSVICTDKTGTLTLNEMTVSSAVTEGGEFAVEGSGYRPEGDIRGGGDIGDLPLAALLCNDAELRQDEEGVWKVNGDPMEGALVTFALKAGLTEDVRDKWKRLDVIPFDSAHRYMATLNEGPRGERRVFVKGAPERILEMCDAGKKWHEKAHEMAHEGQRVLALAEAVGVKKDEISEMDIGEGLRLVGFVGLIDPPRAEAVQAVADCRAAGIRVIMITGDHRGTASAIATQVGLEHPEKVLTGRDLDRMGDEELTKAAVETNVFARTSPGDKLRLVKALQAKGAIIAMTGDGVNDAPALKRSDAGVSMGLKGSEAAKEAAEIILADDNFATLAEAVRQGRTVYDNIAKVIAWTLPTSFGVATVIVAAILIGITLPISAVQVLWINMVTTVTLGIALAFEPSAPDVMRRPPRPRDQPLISRLLVWRIAFVAVVYAAGISVVFLYALGGNDENIAVARTMAVNAIVVMEIFYLFSVRYSAGVPFTPRGIIGTKAVVFSVLGVIAFQFVFTFAPFMHTFFGSASMTAAQGGIILVLGVLVMAILELEKLLTRRLFS